MTPFQSAIADPRSIERTAADMIKKWEEGNPEMRAHFESPEAIRSFQEHTIATQEMWLNDVYTVAIRDKDAPIIHLSIKRNDRQPIHDWRDLQAIKNELIGEDFEAVELYPAESRRVDSANQYHLWVINDNTYRFPFGFDSRLVSDVTIGDSVNRALP